MSQLIQKLLGIDPESWNSGGAWRIEFLARPQGGAAFAAVLLSVVAVVGIWWLYRKEGRNLGVPIRLVLSALRLLILAGVVFMLLEMVIVFSKHDPVPSHLIVLLDTSESMGLKDPYPDNQAAVRLADKLGYPVKRTAAGKRTDLVRQTSRLNLAQHGLGERLLEPLGDGRILDVYGFDTSLRSAKDPDEVLHLKPGGSSTGLGDALRAALAAHRGQPLAGVLIVSDGQSNSGIDPLKVVDADRPVGVPVVTVAVGSDEGPRHARLAGIEASPVVFIRDPNEVAVMLESKGLKGRPATVMLEQKLDGPWTTTDQKQVILGEDGQLQRVVFPFTISQAGQAELRATLSEAGAELNPGDHTASRLVKAIRQRIRTLFIAGSSFPEMQFIRNALMRDPGVEVSCWLQGADPEYEQFGTKPIRRLPLNAEELNRYDVVLLFDPDGRLWPADFPKMLVDFVGQVGGGLVYVAGEQHTHELFDTAGGEGGDAGTPDTSWIKILPVVRDPGLYRSSAEVRLSSRETYSLDVTPEGFEDPVFRFAPDPARNREILANLPGMYWHFPITRAKAGATVLCRHGDPRMANRFGRTPLIATQLYGPGRTIFIGFDSTYRWRYLSEDYFDGFWARLVDRAGRNRLLGGRYPFRLTTDRSAYRVGDQVALSARALNPQDPTLAAGQLVGQVETGGNPPQNLTLEPQVHDPGVFQATFSAAQAGVYHVRVMPAGGEDEGGARAATLEFRVDLPSQELENPGWNRPLLGELARRGGGASFGLAELERIPAAFPVKQVERVLENRTELWDAPLLYGGVFGLLVLEWILRKRFRMT